MLLLIENYIQKTELDRNLTNALFTWVLLLPSRDSTCTDTFYALGGASIKGEVAICGNEKLRPGARYLKGNKLYEVDYT